jgi:rare lipoprotein A
MYSIDLAKQSHVAARADYPPDAPVSSARVSKLCQSLVAILGAASLAACAQSSAVRTSSFNGHSRQASSQPSSQPAWQASRQPSWQPFWHRDRTAFLLPDRHATARTHTPFARPHNASSSHTAAQGIASFYTQGQQTASGETFNTHDLTAAHPTLPFGTHLRVTNVSTGRSVTVRVNDRGPYVAGRVVDVSYSAANALGMVGSGTAKVKLDVVP